ncbi:MAG TPA: Crp/Fnr family transcriptional regulator [Puia sp.]
MERDTPIGSIIASTPKVRFERRSHVPCNVLQKTGRMSKFTEQTTIQAIRYENVMEDKKLTDVHGPIFKNITRHISLSREEENYCRTLLVYQEIPKKTTILSEDQICNQLYYIHSGALRSYCLDKNGKESTIMFAMADWWLTDMYCFLNEKPSMTFIETIEDSCVLSITKPNFDHLFTAIPKFERFFRILLQNAYTREQLRTIENLTLNAEERYSRFINKYPQIASKVTQKQIASYLGITPEFLSVIRKSYLQKK